MLAAEVARWFVWLVAFAWGAAWGSFFNVAIYRWPRGMSVVTPPSHCPSCGEPIRPWTNVPILGWLFLRGKASCCGTAISVRYPLVELLGAILCVAVAELWIVRAEPGTLVLHATIEALLYFIFASGLLIATFVDLEWMEIPDEVSLPGAALGLLSAPFRAEPGLWSAAVGAGAGYLIVQVIFVWGYERIAGRRGMGEGESKLLMMICAFLGCRGALFSVVAGSLQGLLFATFALVTGRKLTPDIEERVIDGEVIEAPEQPHASRVGLLKLPFGPFLALGALEYLLAGDAILSWYFGLLQR
ncbi:MAG: prepilin peptidase [Myxococcales bacterium]|nr:MAG: prepilin peptidase [Myxococcales bacterium]